MFEYYKKKNVENYNKNKQLRKSEQFVVFSGFFKLQTTVKYFLHPIFMKYKF